MTVIRTLMLAALIFIAAGCADDGMFSDCPFDSTISKVCAEDSGGTKLTCVVEAHPQCPENACLSWRGSAPFCTRPCTPDGGQCPGGSTCAAYSEVQNKYFCVEDGTYAQ